MKKILIPFCIAAMLVPAACTDWLTVTPEQEVADNYYTSEDAVRRNTATLYGYVWSGFTNRFMWMAGDELAGDLYYTYEQEGQFYLNTITAGNNYSNQGWTGLYRVVSFANSIINDMPPLAKDGGVEQAAIDYAIAEARFIRGVAYYFLTEYWGDVPIIENSTELITGNNLYVPKHRRGDVYRFIVENLEAAAAVLNETDPQPGRATKYSAYGFLAKVYVTRASDFGNVYSDASQRDEWFAEAKRYAKLVIDKFPELYPSYGELFEESGNNSYESLFARQCMNGGYDYGNQHTAGWARSSIIDQTAGWGAGKGPTISLQNAFTKEADGTPKATTDTRRRWVYMTLGDSYPGLSNEDDGTYVYEIVNRGANHTESTAIEASIPMLAHCKKYVTGNSDANFNTAGNIYFLRLADVFLTYTEAAMGSNRSTSDALAAEYFNAVRARAGLDPLSGDITWAQLLHERRCEFALEGVSWFDVKRYYYRYGSEAVTYLNSMHRDHTWVLNDGRTLDPETGAVVSETGVDIYGQYNAADDAGKWEIENNKDNYRLSFEKVNSDTYIGTPLIIEEANIRQLPIPASVTTKAPQLLDNAVSYYE
ncbi:MAG: RagB/SusD family nutrient uptake outer membrane protein [Prevotellaceae bacterium]|jgi:hypothetical protein|nr:RagB/SusD family nutrient uptake outer membrane protein [Prevotellaceae bacterium]